MQAYYMVYNYLSFALIAVLILASVVSKLLLGADLSLLDLLYKLGVWID
jgi:hypothetical protein